MEFKVEELEKKSECFEINEKTAKDLKNELNKIEKEFLEIIQDKSFLDELDYLMKNFVGRVLLKFRRICYQDT